MTDNLSKYWRTVVDTMLDGLLVVDPSGTVVSMNEAAEALTGYSSQELLGKSCTTLKCTGCKVFGKGKAKHWCSLFRRGNVRQKRCQITNKAGEKVQIVKQASILKDDSGQVLGAVETLTDVSEIIRKETRSTRFAAFCALKRASMAFSESLSPWGGSFTLSKTPPGQMLRLPSTARAAQAKSLWPGPFTS